VAVAVEVTSEDRRDDYPVKTRRKLIEVALPLEAINVASAREKAIRHGHPSTLHLWWARRPLAAARAVIFSQMVDDPSEYVDVLREDPKRRRKAEATLKAKHAAWGEAKVLAEKAEGTGLDVPPPGPEPTLDEILADHERQRLFRIIEELVKWENTTNETVLQAARDEIWASWRRASLDNVDHPRAKELFDRHRLPSFHDPFAGGGALPLEAQRLGLEAYASDLNPVAVLINKAMIEIPPKFAGRPPINPESRSKAGHSGTWEGAAGLAEDVRYYARWMRDEAVRRIGHLYPKVEVTTEMAKDRPDLRPYIGRSLTVIAWIWTRTVKSPNPAFAHVDVPLASTFMLSTKPGKEAYVQPVLEGGGYRFAVKAGKPKDADAARNGTRAGKAQDFLCLMSGVPISRSYIRQEGKARRLGATLIAIVAEGERGRIYLPAVKEHEDLALGIGSVPDVTDARATFLSPTTPTRAMITGGVCSAYGLSTYGDLFTARQIVGLTTFSDLVAGSRDHVLRDAAPAGLPDDSRPLRDGGTGPTAYADAAALYLAFAVSKAADRNSSLCVWETQMDRMRGTFGRQALPMTWDYVETNPFAGAGGDIYGTAESLCEVLDKFTSALAGSSMLADARYVEPATPSRLVSTDPPYYNNIAYADLSDYFYVWLRRSLKPIFPDLFATLAVSKDDELVATPYRHGGKDQAEAFFLDGMTLAMRRLAEQAHPVFPVTIYYAFKQAETSDESGTTNTGWDTFLGAVINAGFAISGTWPLRSELATRNVGRGTNALASSILLVCRRRDLATATATRRELIADLKSKLPAALADLQRGNIAPVDLQQAAIGPGMAVFTGYQKIVDAEGRALKVREALSLINEVLDESLTAQEGDFDADSRWALTWYDQHGFEAADYGTAEQLSKSKNTSVDGMVEAGILESRGGKVRLLKPSELDLAWDPTSDERRPAWQSVHQLIQAAEIGETALADLITKLGPEAETARELAYRLYVLSERKKRATEAGWYNGLVQSWHEAARLAATARAEKPVQATMFGEG